MLYFYKLISRIFSVLLLLGVYSGNIFSQNIKDHPFSNKLVLSFEGGATLIKADYQNEDFGFKGIFSAEYFLPTTVASIFGFKLFGGGGNVYADDVRRNPRFLRSDIFTYGFSITYAYSIRDTFFPYFSAGLSKLQFWPQNNQTNRPAPNRLLRVYDQSTTSYDIEFGTRIALYDRLSIKVGGGFHFLLTDYLDDTKGGNSNDFIGDLTLGISYSFFGSKKDTDKDGVADDEDQCPDTPAGVKVDDFGCPLDSDNDGVPDYLDNCPNTMPGVIVDKKGCTLDSDKDGVADNLDDCPNTPLGVIVDNFGCPVDSDKDGVADYLDVCPDTEPGIEVDESGCPVSLNVSRDDDKDGVFNNNDKCPDTPSGLVVDQNGCPLVFYPQELNKDVNRITIQTDLVFYERSDVIKSEAEIELKKLIGFFEADPFTKWRVEGHIDSIDTEEFNQAISQKRAQAIIDYFVLNKIPSFKFMVKGFGSSKPIFEGSTEEGRRRNRRIEIIKIE